LKTSQIYLHMCIIRKYFWQNANFRNKWKQFVLIEALSQTLWGWENEALPIYKCYIKLVKNLSILWNYNFLDKIAYIWSISPDYGSFWILSTQVNVAVRCYKNQQTCKYFFNYYKTTFLLYKYYNYLGLKITCKYYKLAKSVNALAWCHWQYAFYINYLHSTSGEVDPRRSSNWKWQFCFFFWEVRHT
jgi:hypothetical protein